MSFLAGSKIGHTQNLQDNPLLATGQCQGWESDSNLAALQFGNCFERRILSKPVSVSGQVEVAFDVDGWSRLSFMIITTKCQQSSWNVHSQNATLYYNLDQIKLGSRTLSK